MALIQMDTIGHQLPQLRLAIAANWQELIDTTALIELPHEDIGPGDGLIQLIKKCNDNIGGANAILGKAIEPMPLGYSVRRVREYMDVVFPALSTP